jgi:type IV secretory pathway ATPase VirB11/archaellum biosynthesis ATPase
MSDQAKRDEKATSLDRGNGSPQPKGGGAASEQLNDVLLSIVEREIGRGEEADPEAWARLRAMAVGHPGGSELVATLEGMIQKCSQDMTSRFDGTGLDVSRIRESVVTLIRDSLRKKLGLGERPIRES